MKHEPSALRRGYPARQIIGDEFVPPEGWTPTVHECGALCGGCPFSHGTLYRSPGGKVELCRTCLEQRR